MALQLATAFIDIKAKVGNIEGQLAAVKKSLNSSLNSISSSSMGKLSEFSRATNAHLTGPMAALTQFARQTGAALVPIDTNLQKLAGSAKKTGDSFGILSKQFFGFSIGFFAVQRAIGGLLSSFQSALKFNENLTNALAIQGEVAADQRLEMVRLSQTLGVKLALPIEDVAQGFFELAQAGLDVEQQIKAIPVAARFARAGLLEMAKATSLLNDAQKASGLFVKDAQQNFLNMQRVADVIARASVLSNASIEEIAEATARAGVNVTAFGQSFEEAVATVALFADIGKKAGSGGTAALIVLRDLEEKAIENAAAFRAVGAAVFNAQGAFRGLGPILEDLQKFLSGKSIKDVREELLKLKIPSKSLQFLIAILSQSGRFREFTQELEKAGGTTEAIAANQMQSLTAQLTQIGQQFKILTANVLPAFLRPIIAVGKALGTIVSFGADRETGGLFSRMIAAFAGFVVVGKLLRAVFGALVRQFSIFSSIVGGAGVSSGIRTLGSLIRGTLIARLAELAHRLSVVGPVIEGFFDLIAAAASGLPIVGAFLSKFIKLTGNIVSRVVGIPLGAVLASQFDKIFSGIAKELAKSGFIKALADNAEGIGRVFQHLGRNIVLLVDSLVRSVVKLVVKAFKIISPVIEKIFGSAGNFNISLKGFLQFAEAALKVFADNWKDTWEIIESTVIITINNITAAVLSAALEITQLFGGIFKQVGLSDASEKLVGKAPMAPSSGVWDRYTRKMMGLTEMVETSTITLETLSNAFKKIDAQADDVAKVMELRDLLRVTEKNLGNTFGGKILAQQIRQALDSILRDRRRDIALRNIGSALSRQLMKRDIDDDSSPSDKLATAAAVAAGTKLELPVFTALDELQKKIQEEMAKTGEEGSLSGVQAAVEDVGKKIQENIAATNLVVENTRQTANAMNKPGVAAAQPLGTQGAQKVIQRDKPRPQSAQRVPQRPGK